MAGRRIGTALALGVMLGAGPLAAHPHIFVEAQLSLLSDDQGRLTGVAIDWRYDEMISLALLSDRQMDLDFDGVLTEAELARLQGFDMGWEPGFAGDTYALLGDQALTLGPPQEFSASYADARLASRHVRLFEQPLTLEPGAVLKVQSYDPGFYTSYTVEKALLSDGLAARGCAVQVFAPDMDQADEELKAALAELNPDQDAEDYFPAIGAEFAEEARVTCPSAP